MNKKVALGLSGGVDSAVAALLLKKRGYDVSCIYLNCFDADMKGCRGDQDRKDALAVAMHLGLPFQVLDFRKEYQAAVIDYFKNEYLAGRTPNPDVLCNREIKFGLFLDWTIKNGFDAIATGHYARLTRKGQGTTAKGQRTKEKQTALGSIVPSALSLKPLALSLVLCRPADEHKDQTYFLWAVPKEKFSRVLFPLGEYTKGEVRNIAKHAGITVADKPDSTGICFIGEVRVEDFLKRLGVKEKSGDVVDMSGRVVGRHRGVMFYTIGQRHGFSTGLWPPKSNTEYRMMNAEWIERQIPHSEFSIPRPVSAEGGQNSVFSDRPPLYVIEKDVKKNRLVVGFGAECYRHQFEVGDCNWLILNDKSWILDEEKTGDHSGIQNSEFRIQNCLVRIRHGGELIPCKLQVTRNKLQVKLSDPQRGVAPGQSAVFYSKDGIVLGGGVIS